MMILFWYKVAPHNCKKFIASNMTRFCGGHIIIYYDISIFAVYMGCVNYLHPGSATLCSSFLEVPLESTWEFLWLWRWCSPLAARAGHTECLSVYLILSSYLVLKQCHKPPMTGNGEHSTYKNGDDQGMVYDIVLTTFVWLFETLFREVVHVHVSQKLSVHKPQRSWN